MPDPSARRASREKAFALLFELSFQPGEAIASLAERACEVQRAVKTALQDMTGKTVARVNLKIAGAEFN